MLRDEITLSAIRATTNRLPYSATDMEFVKGYLAICIKKGRDLRLNGDSIDKVTEMLDDGLVILSSPYILNTDFLYVKLNAGRGFFGGQKANYSSFVGSASADTWAPGTSFKNFAIGITSITNIYEQYGLR